MIAVAFLAFAALAALSLALRTWLATLLIGALHSEVAAVPALGWEPTLIIVVLFSLLTTTAGNFEVNR